MSSSTGKTYFLGIGIDQYAHWPRLRNAVRDVRAIAALLMADYGLEADYIRFLCDEDATEDGIIRQLEELADTVTDRDALIIYYAGHGYLHRQTRGFWVPVDAPQQQLTRLIRNSTLRDYIGDIPSLHTLLIADSCFSGSLFVRGVRDANWDNVDELASLPSRWAVSSGRQDEPVADGPPDGHSPFAQSILDVLSLSDRKAITTGLFYEQVREQTQAAYQQQPDGGPLQGVGHKRGQFVFRRRNQEESIWNNCRSQDTIATYEQYLVQFPSGLFSAEANQRLRELRQQQAGTEWAAIQSLPDEKLTDLDTKQQRLRDFVRQHEDSSYLEPALQLGRDLDWKREFLLSYHSEFALLAFVRKDTPYREAARKRLVELEQKRPAPTPAPPKPTPQSPPPPKSNPAVKPALRKQTTHTVPDRKPSSKTGFWTDPNSKPTRIGALLGMLLFVIFAVWYSLPDKPSNSTSPPQVENGTASADNSTPSQSANGINSIEENMVTIAGGTFTMGCQNEARDGDCFDDESPAHEVTLSSFALSRYEVTNAQYAAFLNAEGNQEEGGAEWIDLSGNYEKERCRIKKKGERFTVESGYERHPVIYVSWYGARAYAAWLSRETGQNYRLPTDAEWEYAARGGQKGLADNYLYSGSNDIGAVAWYDGNSGGGTHPVGEKQPNQLGLYDMSGNVREWCSDWFGSYSAEAQTNPQGPDSGSIRVLRGGSWSIYPRLCRVAYRNGDLPTNRYVNYGFRVVLAPVQPKNG